ncbi:MAG: DUF922 domain-containing Zn-dependent protease [Bacteroidales bacterium]|nr:DUF922 domain-containing Zn-dependent protease [Bacteroidales bacterium]
MHRFISLFYFLLLAAASLFSIDLFPQGDPEPLKNPPPFPEAGEYSTCHQTGEGPVIDWYSRLKLKYSDFKAQSKGSPGFAVATTSSAFGYRIQDDGSEVSGSIFVRFYCEESWWNPNFIMDEVLEHEQLHFDICELFGRKLYKEVLSLRNADRLNKRTIQRLHAKFEKQYANYQDKYDKETNHSTRGGEQRKWNEKIKKELDELAEFAGYHEF